MTPTISPEASEEKDTQSPWSNGAPIFVGDRDNKHANK